MQHIIEYRNTHTMKNPAGNPVSWEEAHLSGKYNNMLCVEDEKTGNMLPLREASREEVVIAFHNGLNADEDDETTVDVDINGIITKCYVYADYAEFWHEDRLLTDNIKVNDGQVTYYTYNPDANMPAYTPNNDQKFFELNYDGDSDGEVTATLTNLVTGEEHTWSFTPR